MSTGLSDFPTDKEWIDELCRTKSTDSPIIPSQDPNEHRWGFLEPVNSNHPILHLPRDHDKYNIVPEDSSTNLVVVPWRDDHHPWVKLVKIQGNEPSNWVFCIRTLFPNGQPKYRRFRDRDQLQFGDHVFVFNDTITLDGALIKYQHIEGCETFSGAFGSVTKVALRTDPQVQVALKVVRLRSPGVNGTVSQTYEISALKALSHPHVSRLLDTFATKARDLHIIMEYAELSTLAARVKTHEVFLSHIPPLAGDVFAGSSIFQLCRAVRYIHSQGIMHRDIKPDNLLITSMSPFTLKVADFGQATREERSKRHCGTPPYMAPEVMGRPNYDRRVDLYGIGAVALDLLLVMQNCQNPVVAWKEELDGRDADANAQDILRLLNDRTTSLRTDHNLRMADPRALTLVTGFLKMAPHKRISLDIALQNTWLLEMDFQRYINPSTQSLISTQSADGSLKETPPPASQKTPVNHLYLTPAIHGDVSPTIPNDVTPAAPEETQTVDPQAIQPILQAVVEVPFVIPVQENQRDMRLKRRSSRIGQKARDKVGPYWLYHSGLEKEGLVRDVHRVNFNQ